MKQYVKIFPSGESKTTRFRPLFQQGERERAYAGENPDVLVDGLWWNSVNGDELVSGGNFDSQADVDLWTISGGDVTKTLVDGTMQIAQGTTNNGYVYRSISTEAGKNYTFETSAIITASDKILRVKLGETQGSSEYGDVSAYPSGIYNIEFTAQSTVTYISLGFTASTDSATVQCDNISVYETEIVPDTEYPTQFTYMAKDDKLATFLVEDGQPVDITYEYDSPSIVQNVIQAGRFISQDLVLSNLTTVDPFILGAVWNDSNTLKISQG